MPPALKKVPWWHVVAHLGTFSAFLATTWVFAEPAAEKFVRETIKPDIQVIAEAVGALEATQQAQALNIQGIRENQVELKTKLQAQEKSLTEIKNLQNRILFEIRR